MTFRVPAVLALALFTITNFAFAAPSLEERQRQLRDSGRDYQTEGTVCEEVARLDLEVDFPAPRFDVVTGIAYGDGNRTIGELDVVIFDTQAKRVVKVGEVKCWKNMEGGLRKAREQRLRFLGTISKGDVRSLRFENTTDHQRFDSAQFADVREFITIAQKGAEAAGYDRELDHSLEDMMKLRQMMLACQKGGECKR